MNPLPPQPKWLATSKTDNACLITSESNMCITMIDSTSFTSQGHIVTNKRRHDVATHELNDFPSHSLLSVFFCLTTHKPSILNFCELQVLFVYNKYASTIVRTSNYHQDYHFTSAISVLPLVCKTLYTLPESTPPPPIH